MGVSHLDKDGEVKMVDTSQKSVTQRKAVAESMVVFPGEVFSKLRDADFLTKKGGIFTTAKLAGIMAVKKTAELIPLCHNIPIAGCDIKIVAGDNALKISCAVKTTSSTGVEMEALTGASIAALCVYDMCKALTHDLVIHKTGLISKEGGKSDFRR